MARGPQRRLWKNRNRSATSTPLLDDQRTYPKSHQAHLEWTSSRLIHWAETVGEATALVIGTVLETKRHPEIGYRACLGIMRLGKTYSNGCRPDL